jgi:hypothetical protein
MFSTVQFRIFGLPVPYLKGLKMKTVKINYHFNGCIVWFLMSLPEERRWTEVRLNREEIIRGWRILQNEELHNLFSRVIMSRRLYHA